VQRRGLLSGSVEAAVVPVPLLSRPRHERIFAADPPGASFGPLLFATRLRLIKTRLTGASEQLTNALIKFWAKRVLLKKDLDFAGPEAIPVRPKKRRRHPWATEAVLFRTIPS